jgi:hypothetical protein
MFRAQKPKSLVRWEFVAADLTRRQFILGDLRYAVNTYHPRRTVEIECWIFFSAASCVWEWHEFDRYVEPGPPQRKFIHPFNLTFRV